MLPEAKGRRELAAKCLTIIILGRSSHGEITHIGTYVARGLGPSRASRRRLYHNHLMEVISWRNRNDVTFSHALEQGYKLLIKIY